MQGMAKWPKSPFAAKVSRQESHVHRRLSSMASFLPVLILFFLTGGAMFGSWVFIPKGPQQVLIRTSLLLTFTCCYLMWAITYMAQLHPLVVPLRNANH